MTIEEGAQVLNLKCSLQEVGVVGLMWKRHTHKDIPTLNAVVDITGLIV